MLKEYLDYADDLDKEIEKIYLYAHLNMDVDTTDVTYQTHADEGADAGGQSGGRKRFRAAGDYGYSGGNSGKIPCVGAGT